MASPRQRAARWRYVQYVVLVLVLLAIAFIADWEQIQRAFWNWELVKEQFPRVLTIALKNTIIYTACGFAFGLVLGLLLALMRLSSVGPYRWIATAVIELFRGLPALVELILLTKDSSLVYILGLSLSGYELTKFGREGMNSASNLTPIIVIALCYLLITVPLSIV